MDALFSRTACLSRTGAGKEQVIPGDDMSATEGGVPCCAWPGQPKPCHDARRFEPGAAMHPKPYQVTIQFR